MNNIKEWLETPIKSFNIIKKDYTLVEMYYREVEKELEDENGENEIIVEPFNIFKSSDNIYSLSDQFHRSVKNPEYDRVKHADATTKKQLKDSGRWPQQRLSRMQELEQFRYFSNKFNLFDNGILYYLVPDYMLETELTKEKIIEDYESIFTEIKGLS